MTQWKSGLAEFFDRHLALAVTGVTTLIFVWKIAYAARYDPTVALAIVTATPTPTLLLGLAVALFPAALTFTIGALAGVIAGSWVRRQPTAGPAVALVLVLSLALSALPLSTLLIFVLALPVLVWLMWPQRSGKKSALELGRGVELVWLVTFVALLLQQVVYTAPWPTERVEVLEGDSIVGYVLDDSRPWVTVLTLDDALVLRIASTEIRARELCEPTRDDPPPWFGLPLGESITQLRSPTALPPCEANAESPDYPLVGAKETGNTLPDSRLSTSGTPR